MIVDSIEKSQGICHKEEEEEEEEKRSPGRAHPPRNPMVPAGPQRSGRHRRRGALAAGPAWLSIMAGVLLYVSSPWSLGPLYAHPRARGAPRSWMGGEAERRFHFRHGLPLPPGDGDTVSRV